MSSSSPALPDGWTARASKSHAGKTYYLNTATGETTWEVPGTAAVSANEDQVRVLHILKKHCGSRRPASWRCDNITQSKQDSINQINDIRAYLLSVQAASGFEEARLLFQQIATKDSDCSSAQRGGDLGLFGRGQMQKPFEEASFGLNIGEISELVDTDSGIHIILRIA